MKYSLFKKEVAPSWEEAKEKFLESASYDENRINQKYKDVFPYDYNPKFHFVYEGEITGPYIIQPDFTLYFLNDREQIEKGYKSLRTGEILDGDKIINIPSPGSFYEWENMEWVLNIDKKKSALLTEIEREKKSFLENGFLWDGKYQQKCRPSIDIPFIRESLENFNLIPNYTQVWYFSNYPEGYTFASKDEFLKVRNMGMIFVGTIFKIESELKLEINNIQSKEDLIENVRGEYLNKLKEFKLPE